MKMLFENLPKRLESGMSDFLKFHHIAESSDGLTVSVKFNSDNQLMVSKAGNQLIFDVSKENQIFRAVTLTMEQLKDNNSDFSIEENCYFDLGCPMFDQSQASSLMNLDSCKKMMLILAGMGFDSMMLYCEDCYEVEGEPYFGHMRPKYMIQDFKELDAYAYSLGLELIPCIQTLGHLPELIKRPPYSAISDTAGVLMVGEDKVYELIDKIIGQISRTFRTRKIHVGLDEAWDLGLGNYLKKNGYRNQTDLMNEHVPKVCALAKKHGLEPMMWSDMYFRAKAKGNYRDLGVQFTEEDRKMIPENVSLVYWDYSTEDAEKLEAMIASHRSLTDKVILAGCVRKSGFAMHMNKAIAATNAIMTAGKKTGIRKIIATSWGDDHREGSNFAALPVMQLFAEHMYSETPDQERVKARFEYCMGESYEMFAALDRFDTIPAYNGDNMGCVHISKLCMWQDIMLGLLDKDLKDIDFSEHYRQLKEDLKGYLEQTQNFKAQFNFYYHLANVLETKSYIGVRLAKAYRNQQKEELTKLCKEVLPALYEDVKALRVVTREYYFTEFKPIGWEVTDIRLAGVMARIDTAIMRLEDYLSGKINQIDELEQERLSYNADAPLSSFINYINLCSASRL